jgi:hypothetical protein
MQDTYPKSASHAEVVTLNVPFQESYPDTEGAKRVVVCQLNDMRLQTSSIGDGTTGGAPRKFVVRQDLTLVLTRIFGEYLKQAGFNVSFDDRLPEAGGNVVREVLKKHDADYLIAGNLQELSCRVRMDTGRPVFAVVSVRLDIYNNEGRLRMYYPAELSDAEFLGDKADDPAELSAFVERSIRNMFAKAFDDDLFIKALDLDPDTIRERMKTMPEPKKSLSEEDQRRELEKDLEKAVKEGTEPKGP